MDNNLPEGPKRPPLIVWILIIVALIAAVLGGVYFYMLKTGKLASLFPKPTPVQNIWQPPRESSAPLPHGPQTYIVGGSFAGPKITKITFEPLDPQIGENQTITVKANDTNSVSEIKITAAVDGKSNSFILKLTGGNDKEGSWQGSWKIPGTYKNTYSFVIEAKSATGTSRLEYPFR